MAVLTGKVGKITVSGTVISGEDKTGMEATVNIGRERDRFTPVGTDVYEDLVGMKTVEGTVRKAWVSGDSLFQDLIDGDLTFEVTINSDSSDQSITASGCKVTGVSRRVAPGTEVMVEELTFTGRNWY